MLENLMDVNTVTPEQRAYLLEKLSKVEDDFNVKIIYAAISGSRLFGLNNGKSDFDVKFIYIDQLKWYFNPTKKSSTISLIEGDCDFIGFNMDKTIMSVIKSSGTLLEWIRSDVVLIEQPDFLPELKSHIEVFYNPIKVFNYYNHVTRKIYINIKLLSSEINDKEREETFVSERRKIIKYFFLYVRTSLSLHLCDRFNQIPIKFNELVTTSELDPNLKKRILSLMDLYRADSGFYIEDMEDFNIMVTEIHLFSKNYVFEYKDTPYISPTNIINFHKKVVLDRMD